MVQSFSARDLAAHNPGKYYYADQYNNDANWRAHYQTTAPEIWDQSRRAHNPFRRWNWHNGHIDGKFSQTAGVQVVGANY